MLKGRKHYRTESVAEQIESLSLMLEHRSLDVESDEDIIHVNFPMENGVLGEVTVHLKDVAGDYVWVEFMDYYRQAIDNGMLDRAIEDGAENMFDVVSFIDEHAHWDEFDASIKTRAEMESLCDEIEDIVRDVTAGAKKVAREMNRLLRLEARRTETRRVCRRHSTSWRTRTNR